VSSVDKKISFDFRLRPGWKGFLATDGSGPVLLMLLVQEEAMVSGGSFFEGRVQAGCGCGSCRSHVPIRSDVARHKADKDKYLGETKKLNKI
jgi:hypothetical protein